jgi:PAS domain S-box-containing protein
MKNVEDGFLYRHIVEHAADIIATLDSSSGRIVYISPSVRRVLGYTPEELVGTPIGGLAAPGGPHETVPSLDQRVRSVEAGDQSALVATDRLDVLRHDGAVVTLELTTALVTGVGGRVTDVVCVARDITRRASLETARRPPAEQSAEGRSARRAVHDLNNLLTAVLGYATFALTCLSPDHPASADVRELRDAAAQAAELVRVRLARVDEP